MFWPYYHKTLEYNLLYGTVTRKTTKQNTGYKMFFLYGMLMKSSMKILVKKKIEELKA